MAAPRKDPEIRRRCSCCGGPVYVDEPEGCYCPDCAAVFLRMIEAHGPGQRCDADAGPPVYRTPARWGRQEPLSTGGDAAAEGIQPEDRLPNERRRVTSGQGGRATSE